MAIAAAVLRPHRFSRSEYYAIAGSLDPSLQYELLDGVIYGVSPAKPPHAGIVTFFLNRFRVLNAARFLIRSQDVLEIEPDGSPEPDVAVVRFRPDYYSKQHPNGRDARLVIEIGDTERNPREKMRTYMRDGNLPLGWRIDIPGRFAEIWTPSEIDVPSAILRGPDDFRFETIAFTVDEVFSIFES